MTLSYLDEAVTEISTSAGDGAAFLHVEQTQATGILHGYDARDLAERFFKQDRSTTSPVNSVVQEVDDGWQVMIMVE